MKKAFLLILLGMVSVPCFAQAKIFSCVNKETNFMTTFLVDFGEKSVTHLNSQSPNSNQKFTTNTKLITLTFNSEYSIALSMSNEGKILNLSVFNFTNNTYSNSGHYLDKVQKPFPQLFSCVTN